jgi:beta-glucanase (GH16 family)
MLVFSLLPMASFAAASFSDEFNYTGAPSSANWTYETGYVRNNEPQYYRSANASVNGSNLVITAKKNDAGYAYTSASVISKGKKSFCYGTLTFSAKIPTQTASWPAWWALGTNFPGTAWPKCGEIDMMEWYNGMNHYNYCYQNSSGAQTWDAVTATTPSNYGNSYHTWQMKKNSSTIEILMDGTSKNSFTVSNATVGSYNPFKLDMYVLMNIALRSPSSSTVFPMYMYVDYMRYVQQ